MYSVVRKIRWFILDIINFGRNIHWYRKFLWEDVPWDNESLMRIIQLKLRKTKAHYERGLGLFYEGEEEDFKNINQAYETVGIIISELEENPNPLLSEEELEVLTEELFTILKDYRKWWD